MKIKSIPVKYFLTAVSLVATLLIVSGCSQKGEPKVVRLATHDSFAISADLVKDFQNKTGLTLKIVRLGDAGSLTNKLVLTKNDPIADVTFGIDNTFAGVATSNKIINGKLIPVDFGDVCFNYDVDWFKSHSITPPASWRDLTSPTYRNLTVIENPKLSSTGLAFLATTYAGFPTASQVNTYWKALKANGVKITSGWEDAYYVDFSGSSGKGSRPIVLSYSSSPADEVGKDGKSRTAALLSECFRQTEYVGIILNGLAPKGAQKFIDFLLSDKFQASMPESMYVYPINPKVELPKKWTKFAPFAKIVIGQDLDIQSQRATWLKAWWVLFGN